MKTLCKIHAKEYDELLPKIRKIVKTPKYLCRKCLRAASDKKVLCKPEAL